MLGFQAARVAVVSYVLFHGFTDGARGLTSRSLHPPSPPAAGDIAAQRRSGPRQRADEVHDGGGRPLLGRRAGEGQAPHRHPLPCLRWNNPISGSSDGIVTVLTDGGRPAMIVQFFKTKGPAATGFTSSPSRAPQGLKLQKDARTSGNRASSSWRSRTSPMRFRAGRYPGGWRRCGGSPNGSR